MAPTFFHSGMMFVQNAFVIVQEGKPTCTIFSPQWIHVVQSVFVFVQKGKLVRASFPP
jgi:hypothetical protein